MDTEPAIRIRDLRKAYGDRVALRGIDLDVARGEVFALLGPNGAGKTTAIEICEGHRDRDGGEVSVLGHDPRRHERRLRERIGIVLQSTGVDPYLTVRETVELFAGYYPRRRAVDEVVELVGLSDAADQKVAQLSGGQRRRVDLAVGLAGDPELLFLDEPTTGFDPAARRQAWETIRGLRRLGTTIVLTTHYLDEAQALADRVAIIADGRIVASGTPDTLGTRGDAPSQVRFRLPAGVQPPTMPGLAADDALGQLLATSDPTRALHELTGWAIERGVTLEGLEVSRPSLEDTYLELTAGAEAE
ncbi:MAG: ABC transporter ATP-binding protein [Chloroflexota bacterium]